MDTAALPEGMSWCRWSPRQAAKFINKMRVKSGDILVIKKNSGLDNQVTLDALRQALGELRIYALILIVDNLDDISKLDEKEMAKHGWFHPETLLEIMKKIKKERENG